MVIESSTCVLGQRHLAFDDGLSKWQIRQFAFVTAWNPGSQLLPTEENEHRNQALEVEICRLTDHILCGFGISDNRQWSPEASYCALDILPEQAVALGQAFGQNALVFGRKGGVPELWWLPRP